MIIPSIQILKDINKTLLFIEALSKNTIFPKGSAILRATSSISYGDKKGHEDTFRFLTHYNFIAVSEDGCQITPLGWSFVSLNSKKYIEANSRQKNFLLKFFLRDKQINTFLLEILRKYGFSKTKEIIIDLSSSDISSENSLLISALKWLGFFNLKEGVLVTNPKYITFLEERDKQGLSFEQLREILQEQLKYSSKAENLAFEFEKKRLKDMGSTIQSKLVRLVAEENISLGYDLMSFSKINSARYDRFIEVKCSKRNKVRFFWTINEYNVARKLKDRYWIYFFPNIITNTTPVLYSNPSQIFKPPKYKVISTEFIVEEN